MSLPNILTAVKVELNKSPTETADDAALLLKIAAAWAEIERRIGHVDVVDVVETVDVGCDGMAVLAERPVLEVSSVLLLGEDGSTVRDLGAGTSPAASGVLYGLPNGTLRITYTAGRDPLPGDYLEAATQLSAHLWRQARALDGQGRVRSELTMGPGMSSAMPNKVKDLLGLMGKSARSRVFAG